MKVIEILRVNPATKLGLSDCAVYMIVAVMSLVYGFYLFPTDFIVGSGAYWDGLRADTEISIIGMRYFLADSWHFPILQTKLLMPPEGVNIIYTDSVPLFGLIAKVFRFLLPSEINYFGVYYLLMNILQAVTAMYLVRTLSVKSLLPQIAVAVMALSIPAFLFRTTLHASLTAHFLILWALGLYFSSVRQTAMSRIWYWFACVLIIALLIHAYLFLMVLAIFVAATMQHMTLGRKEAIASASYLAAVGVLIIGIMWLAGYFSGVGKTEGFGHYSMNLLSPWVPQRSGLFPSMQKIIDATGGQHEGFNYLGIGVLILLGAALVLLRKDYSMILRKYWALGLVMGCFFILAASNRVFIGEHLFLEVGSNIVIDSRQGSIDGADSNDFASADTEAFENSDLAFVVKEGLQQVRSSGRLFWPIGYLILAGSLAIVSRRLQPNPALLVILFCSFLQVMDATQLRQEIRDKFSMRVKPSNMPESLQYPPDIRWADATITAKLWKPLIAHHQKLTVIPSFECAGFEKRWDVLDLVFHASSSATPANTAYLARRAHSDNCEEQISSLAGLNLEYGEILVVLTPPVPRWPMTANDGFRDWCRSFSLGFVCTRLWGEGKLVRFESSFQKIRLAKPQYRVD